jgi:tetratricopeptide (TPR) repeat protein
VARSVSGESFQLFQENGDDLGAGRSLFWLARAAVLEESYDEARDLFQRGLAYLRAADDKVGIANALMNLGRLLTSRGDSAAAAPLYEESRAIIQEVRGRGERDFFLLRYLAEIAIGQGDYGSARSLLSESLAVTRAIRQSHLAANDLDRLALLAIAEGKLGEARAHLEESLELAREFGSRSLVGPALGHLAHLGLLEGDDARARELFRQALACLRDTGPRSEIASCIDGLGIVAIRQGARATGVQLIAAATARSELFQSGLSFGDRAGRAASLEAAREALGDEEFARARARGESMSLEQAIACALGADEG